MLSRRTVGIVAAVAVISMVLAACGGGRDSGGNGNKILTLSALVAPATFAAANIAWANESPYAQAVYDSLLRETPDAQVEPWLATEWSYNEDKTVLTMKLRTDVVFTDGTRFDATVAAQNILRFRDGTAATASYLASVSDAKAVDASTLQISLSQPEPALLIYLAQNAGVQASPRSFGAPDEQTKPVGSGPYVLDAAQTVGGSKYVFTKNPGYWAPAERHYDGLVINIYQTIATQVNAIQGGQVNGVLLSDNTANDQIKATGYSLFPNELDWQGLMLLDREGKTNPALADVRVRRAINHAIDREAMLKGANRGFGTVTGQIFGKTNPAYDESLDHKYPYDPGKARQLLAEAGHAGGMTLRMPLIQTGSTTAYDLVKQYLGDVGITVEYEPAPLTIALPDILAPKYAASYFRLQQNPTAWQVAKFSIAPSATFNPYKVSDPRIDSLLGTIQRGSQEESAAAAKQLNQYIVDQAWFAPFYRNQGNFAADENTQVVVQSDNAFPYLHNITPKD